MYGTYRITVLQKLTLTHLEIHNPDTLKSILLHDTIFENFSNNLLIFT